MQLFLLQSNLEIFILQSQSSLDFLGDIVIVCLNEPCLPSAFCAGPDCRNHAMSGPSVCHLCFVIRFESFDSELVLLFLIAVCFVEIRSRMPFQGIGVGDRALHSVSPVVCVVDHLVYAFGTCVLRVDSAPSYSDVDNILRFVYHVCCVCCC